MKAITLFGTQCLLEFGTYGNGTVAVHAITADERHEPFITATVNYEPGWQGAKAYALAFPFPAVVLKNYSENYGIVAELERAGVIERGGCYLSGSSGTVEARLLTSEWQAEALLQGEGWSAS